MHATVYKCFGKSDLKKEKPFAVKVVREEDPEKIQAHKNEFEIMNKLNHPNIIKSHIQFVDSLKCTIHLVMDFIEGKEIFDQISNI